eukprot:scaffold68281_cov17-Prasinocladus_malaysianus.AAC.3
MEPAARRSAKGSRSLKKSSSTSRRCLSKIGPTISVPLMAGSARTFAGGALLSDGIPVEQRVLERRIRDIRGPTQLLARPAMTFGGSLTPGGIPVKSVIKRRNCNTRDPICRDSRERVRATEIDPDAGPTVSTLLLAGPALTSGAALLSGGIPVERALELPASSACTFNILITAALRSQPSIGCRKGSGEHACLRSKEDDEVYIHEVRTMKICKSILLSQKAASRCARRTYGS